MKVAHITYHYMPIVGGQEVYIKNLIDVLKKEGIHNDVYQPLNKNYHYFSKNKDNNVKLVFSLPILGRFLPVIGKYLFNLFLLLHYFSFFRYDRIIVHYAFHSLPFWFFKKKVIVLSHGVEWYLDNKTINDKISHLIASITFNRFKIVANDTHYYRTLNLNIEPCKKYFEEIEPNKWFIPNCVDASLFRNYQPLGKFKDRKIILVPRQITWDRGIHLAIEAFNLFSHQQKDFELLIVGPIRGKEYKSYCDSLIQKFGLSKKVFWKHNVNNSEIINFYNSAKITLIPTIRREGTSLSALESMACGCPIISTNVAGLGDLPSIKAEPTAEDLARVMIESINKLNDISKDQQNQVRKVFNMQNWADAWMHVINIK